MKSALPKLYHFPMACSTAVRIAAARASVPVEVIPVNVYTKEIGSGGSLYDINIMGQVPTLILPDGELLTENVAVLFWLEQQSGDGASIQTLRWLSFCATEMHKQLIWPLVRSNRDKAIYMTVLDRFKAIALYLETHLTTSLHLGGQKWSAADAYLLWCLKMLRMQNIRTGDYPALAAYFEMGCKDPQVSAIFSDDLAALNNFRRKAP